MTHERIQRCFSSLRERGKPALIAFVTTGDPNVEESTACALAALEAGADMLELGVPFSDPTADGHVIAAASYRAIHNGGSLRAALGAAERIRARSEAPIVLFTYYNPVLAFGETRLVEEAVRIGVDGILVVDLPPEEGADFRAAARNAGIAIIPLLAPTSGPDRVERALAGAQGFVYYVSLTGVTGSTAAPLQEAGRTAIRLRERAKLPVVVGFGIDSEQKARTVAQEGVDGIAVGTAIVKTIAAGRNLQERTAGVRRLIGELRRGLDG